MGQQARQKLVGKFMEQKLTHQHLLRQPVPSAHSPGKDVHAHALSKGCTLHDHFSRPFSMKLMLYSSWGISIGIYIQCYVSISVSRDMRMHRVKQ